MPFDSFQHLSDEDVQSVVAYLRSVPPQRQARAPIENEVPFVVRFGVNSLGIGRHPPARDVRAPSPAEPLAYGEYLVQLATCADCHSLGRKGTRSPKDRYLAGSDVPFPEGGEVWARNLTPDPETGIGRYSREQVKAAIRQCVRLDGKKMAPPMSDQSAHYRGMTDADLDAIVAFLFSLPPVKQQVPPRRLDAATRERLGED
jgi:mono/diheme cytochrome c family protein